MSSPRLSHPPLLCRVFALLALCAKLASGGLESGLNGAEAVGPYLNGVFPTSAPGNPSGWALVNAFPNVVFTEPLTIVEIPRSNEFLVVGKTGLAWRFPRDPAVIQSQVVQVLDMTGVTQRNEDQGFYSITFHPNFGLAGATGEDYVYACYNRRGDPSVNHPTVSFWCLSRFTWNRATGTIDPASEFMMIRQYDPHDWHNGGAAFFGPDGFYYLTTGDGGGNGDSTNSSQKLDQSLFGGVLRIDVDNDPARSHPVRRQPRNNIGWTQPVGWPATMSQGYSIPNDNPWLDPAGSILEEFWAIGLRSLTPATTTPSPATSGSATSARPRGKRSRASSRVPTASGLIEKATATDRKPSRSLSSASTCPPSTTIPASRAPA